MRFTSLSIFFLLLPVSAIAHGGGLDGLGCHHNEKLGGYHCHKGQLAGQEFLSKGKALNALQGGYEKPAEDLKGKPRIVDGDTIWIGSTKVRLHGIDAPESKQTCQKADGSEYRCGEMATFALAEIIETHWITCKGEALDHYKRRIAVCYAGPYDINAEMVRRGWALAYRRYSTDYVDEEEDASSRKAGMWQGKFVEPWEWRKW